MSPERWHLLNSLYDRAAAMDPAERTRFIEEQSGDDEALRRELLAAFRDEASGLTGIVGHAAAASAGAGEQTMIRDADPRKAAGPAGASEAALIKGRYRVERELDHGGLGVVYLASDTALHGRKVVIKMPLEAQAEDPWLARKFLQEVKALALIDHPGVVVPLDSGVTPEGRPFLVMQYVEGRSLQGAIPAEGMPLDAAADVLRQIGQALAAAHAKGIWHRDLKPANIMLRMLDSGECHVRLIDFGIASVRDKPGGDTGTRVVGTVHYMAPEQMDGRVSEATDVYALGVIAYEMATGRKPFATDNVLRLPEMHKAGVTVKPSLLRPDLPQAAEKLILQALSYRPEDRPKGAAAFTEELARALSAPSAPAERKPAPPPTRAGRRGWVVAAAVFVAIALAAPAGWFLVKRQQETAYWDSIQGRKDAALFEAYLREYPRGQFASLARTEIEILARQPAAAAEPPGSPVPKPANTAPSPQTADGASPPKPTVEPKATVASNSAPATPPANVASPKRNPDTPDFVGVSKLDSPVIETIAGREWRFSGDGKPARQVPLGSVYGVACDRAGNIYAADWLEGSLFKIDTAGVLHVLAGPDSPPENRPSYPLFVTVAADGALYFTQDGDVRIRKVSPNGRMETVAGTGRAGFTPDGFVAREAQLNFVRSVAIAPDGTIVFSERNRIRRIDRQGLLQTIAGNGQEGCGGDGGPALAATLNPEQLAYDAAGNLLIADRRCAGIRKVTPGGVISTVGGNAPTAGVAVNSRGEVLMAAFGVAGPGESRIFKLRDGGLSSVGGTGPVWAADAVGVGGPATQATFESYGLAVDARDNLYSGGWAFGHVYRIDPNGKLTIVAGNGQWRLTLDGSPARDASFRNLQYVVLDGKGNIFLADERNSDRIYRIDTSGTITRFAGGFRGPYRDNVAAREASLGGLQGLGVRPNGSLVLTIGQSHRLVEVAADGQVHTLAGTGRAGYGGDRGRALDASLNNPFGICLDSAGNIYVADANNQRVRKVSPDGRINLVAGNGVKGFAGDGGPAEQASLNGPGHLAVGPDGALYISDTGNNRVRRVSGGTITTIAGSGSASFGGDGGPAVKASLFTPTELAFGPDRMLYVLDLDHSRIRRIDLVSGIISTVAGNGDQTESGDGGPPLRAGLGAPRGLAIDSAGNLYVTDVKGTLRIIRPARNQNSLPGN